MNKRILWTKWLQTAAADRGAGMMRRVFAAYVGFAFLLFLLAGAAAMWQSHTSVEPKQAMKRMAASVRPEFFIDMLALEQSGLERGDESSFSGKKVGVFLSGLLLHFNPFEPKSLLASELPGMRGTLHKHGGADEQREKPGEANRKPGEAPPANAEEGGGTTPGPQGESPTIRPQPVGGAGEGPEPVPAPLDTKGKKVVFVYHSHPRESWVPELQVKSVNLAEDAEKNVTMLGKRLADKLEEAGIGASHSGTDYPTAIKDYNWNFSYKYSLQTVKEAFANNADIRFLFDIHRDSAGRNITTATIGGKDYAKVYFIVGKKNENWEQNEAFAKKIHEKLEAGYPGLSRGIWDKGSGGHAEYNQSVSPNSILMEVGGPYNTLEESYRTIDVMAKLISEVYWDAEKVNVNANAVAKR